MKLLIVNKLTDFDGATTVQLKIILTGFSKFWLGIPCDEQRYN